MSLRPAKALDLRGLRCPLPVLRVEAALRHMQEGQRLQVVADDPIARLDIPHFMRAAGHMCVEIESVDGACVFEVTRGR